MPREQIGQWRIYLHMGSWAVVFLNEDGEKFVHMNESFLLPEPMQWRQLPNEYWLDAMIWTGDPTQDK